MGSTINLGWLKERTNQETNQIAAHHALAAMSDWRYVTGLGAAERWPDRVARVALLPEGGSWFGVVGQGVNQLLGYLVFYRPRLFLAALLAGGYLGWALNRRYEWAHDKAISWRIEQSVYRRAA